MRLMADDMIATHLENLDRRLARVEQILPTLATREELRIAIAPLATRAELRVAIAEAIAPLATKQELEALSTDLRREIRDEGEQSRRYMDGLIEGQRSDIQLLAGHLTAVLARLSDR
jgi:hypothetical protein